MTVLLLSACAGICLLTLPGALPLMRWAPGLSLGLQYARLFSATNELTQGAYQLDLALSLRA